MAGDTEGDTAAPLPSLVVSATRQEMPQSQVSSDITVITKEEMSHLPVHDMGEALNYIPGLVLDRNGGPGSLVFPSIQGSESRHVKILIDDIPLELLMEGVADLSMLPLENVERVEVLKGSASSVWGSSLGGVINIITRKPSEEPTGEVGVSVGEENTRKYSGLISGKASGVGYLLTASRYETDGFFKNTESESNNIYAKVTKELGKGLSTEASYGHNDIDRGFGVINLPEFDYINSSDNKQRDSYGRVKLDYAYNKDTDLSLSLYDRVFYYKRKDIGSFAGFPLDSTLTDRENSYGAILKSGWRHSNNWVLSAGAEASHGTIDFSTETKEYDTDKRAIYMNESFGDSNLTINTGVRFDEDYAFGSEISPSMGLVYHPEKAKTLFRLNIARGFTPPPLLWRYYGVTPNKDLNAERAWTYQAGIETHDIPGLWGKVTFYRADIDDAVEPVADESDADGDGDIWEVLTFENIKKFRRQGVEVEARTAEYKGISLFYGYAFNDIKDLDSDKIVKNKARVTHDIGIDYRGPFETKTTVKGHYVYWNADGTPGFKAKDDNFIWDAKVSKYLAKWKGVMGELFVSGHNIFSEKQYLMEIYQNPGTWWEGGISLTFY